MRHHPRHNADGFEHDYYLYLGERDRLGAPGGKIELKERFESLSGGVWQVVVIFCSPSAVYLPGYLPRQRPVLLGQPGY